MAGILAGTGSSIANQRYKDSVQDTVNILRDVYSYVSDTQIPLREAGRGVCGGLTSSEYEATKLGRQTFNSGRGRTDCAVYGAVVSINGSDIQMSTLIGEDYASALLANPELDTDYPNDLDLLRALNANNLAVQCGKNNSNCHIATASDPINKKLKWDTTLVNPKGNAATNTPFKKTLLIFRSPRNGVIRTYVMDSLIMDGTDPVDYTKYVEASAISYSATTLDRVGVHGSLESNKFKVKEVQICVDSNGSQSYAGHRRMIKVARNAHSQTGIQLIDMDDDTEGTCD